MTLKIDTSRLVRNRPIHRPALKCYNLMTGSPLILEICTCYKLRLNLRTYPQSKPHTQIHLVSITPSMAQRSSERVQKASDPPDLMGLGDWSLDTYTKEHEYIRTTTGRPYKAHKSENNRTPSPDHQERTSFEKMDEQKLYLHRRLKSLQIRRSYEHS